MSTPMINFPPFRPYTNITPFTVRDGATYLTVLEELRNWLNTTLVPHVDTEVADLVIAWEDNANTLLANVITALNEQNDTVTAQLNAQNASILSQLNDQNAAITAQLAAQDANVTDQINTMTAYVDNAVQSIINSTIEVSDPVILGVLNANGNSTQKVRDLSNAELESAKGIANGVATLDGSAKLPETQVPDRLSDDSLTENYAPRLAVYVDAFNPDPTGVTSSDAAILAALAALGSSPGFLIFGTGTYKFSTSLELIKPGQRIVGQGRGATFLSYQGAGRAMLIRPDVFSSATQGGGVVGLTLEGTGAEPSTDGIEFGDLIGAVVEDFRVRDFPGNGVVLKNDQGWLEQSDIRLTSGRNGGAQVCMDGSDDIGGGASFMYNDFNFRLFCTADTDGISLINSASVFGGTFTGIFNAERAVSNSGTMLSIGAVGEVGDSGFVNTGLHFTGESNGTGQAPATVRMQGNAVIRDSGQIWFHGEGWQAPTLILDRFSFSGRCNLSWMMRQTFHMGLHVLGGIGTRSQPAAASLESGTLTINPDRGTGHRVVLGNGAHTFAWGGGIATGESTGICYDIFLMLVQPPSGSAATMTWHASITWVSGSAPTLKSNPNGLDYFRMTRLPNGNWYAQHLNP